MYNKNKSTAPIRSTITMRTLAIVFLMVVTLLSAIATPFAPSANALTAYSDEQTPTWRATSWWYYKAVLDCMGTVTNWNISNPDAVNSGRWVGEGSAGSAVGYYMRNTLPGIGDDGSVNCNEGQNDNNGVFRKAFDHWGLNGTTVACDSKVLVRFNGTDCVNGNGNFTFTGSRTSPKQLMETYLKNTVYGGKEPGLESTTGSQEADYIYDFTTFTSSCAYGVQPLTSKPDGANVYSVLNPEKQPVWYIGTMSANESVNYSPNPNTKRTCLQLVNNMNDHVNDYIQWGVDHPTTPDIAPGAGTGKHQCEANPNDPSCKDTSKCKIDGLGWIICPVVYFMSGITDGAYSAVSDMLTTPPVDTNLVTDGSNPLYAAWSMMRSFANVAFVIAFVLIIYSQMTGGGIGNYTVKKMLPKLVVAAILVNISYWLCAIAVDISNILGSSVRTLFQTLSDSYKTNSTGTLTAALSDGNNIFTNIAGVVLVTTGTAAMILVYPAVFLPIMIAALAAIVAVLITLTMRAGLIIMLIVVSPLAFVAYLLPNTESLFKSWLKLFQVLLAMFPVIAAVFGICAFAGKIIMNSASGNVFVQIMGAGVVIVPLFLVPALMKLGGGLLTRWAGVVNNPNKGVFDRMRKGASEVQANSAFMRGVRIRKQARQAYRDGVYARRLTGEGGSDLVNKLTQARSAGVSGAVDYGANKANEGMAALKGAAAGTAFEGAVNATATGVNKATSLGSGQRKAEADALRRAAQGAVAEAARKEVAEAREVLKQTTTVDNAKTNLLANSSQMSDVDVEAHIDFILSEGGENEVRAIAKNSTLMANHGVAAWRAIRRNDSNIRGKHKDIANFASNNGGQNIVYDPATRTEDATHYTDTVKGMQASQLIGADPSMLNQPVMGGGTGENFIDVTQAQLAQSNQAFSNAKPGTQQVINRVAGP